jgi:hypothetical protein
MVTSFGAVSTSKTSKENKKYKMSILENEWLPEQLKTIRNLTEIADILIHLGKENLIPTILELLQVEIQEAVLENCVREKQE